MSESTCAQQICYANEETHAFSTAPFDEIETMEMLMNHAKRTIAAEIEALQEMSDRLGSSFAKVVDIILSMQGRLVVMGMGKSGIIGQKIAATLASTGTPSFFVHPGEAFHGDLGMIKPSDVALLISNSGETEEVIRILPFLLHQKNKIVALTGRTGSTLAQNAYAVLDVGVSREACNNNLAPTSSTTCTLVMGDALAVALSVERQFQPEDFARFHPGGSLGRKLLTQVRNVMRKDNLPICAPNTLFRDIVHTINVGKLGLALVMEDQKLLGLITDGDVRRAFDCEADVRAITAAQIMTRTPKTISESAKLAEAEEMMHVNKINSLVVIGEQGTVSGVLQIYDL
jgi:arabinose-5-phosphate isomerase